MEPRELARLVFERVVDYCENHSGDTPLDCMLSHNPYMFSEFDGLYLNDEELEELQTVEDPKAYNDEAEEEYAKLWNEWMSEEVAYGLGHLDIEDLAYNIANSDKLDNTSKVERLKAYTEVLREFANAIKLALQEKKPLSSANLHKWFKRLAEFAPSDQSEYIKEADYYLDFYDMYEVDQLLTLDLLLQYVDRALRKIENKYLPELEALTNKI